MTERIHLTALEIDAILTVAGDADCAETLASTTESEEEAHQLYLAFESGMDKLRTMLARRIDRRAP